MAGASARSAAAAKEALERETDGLVLPRQNFWDRNQDVILGCIGITTVLVFWETFVNLGILRANWVSSPSRIVAMLPTVFGPDDILGHLQVSSLEFLYGFGVSVLIGVPFGMLTGWYRPIRGLTEPIVSALFSTPTVALVPILILIFGIDVMSKAAVVFLSAIWPIVINTSAGIMVLDKGWLDAARTFGASDARIFRTIGLPATVPFIIAGLRTAMARALVGVVVGELYASRAGIGFYLNRAGQTFQTDKYYVAVTIIALIGVAMVYVLQRIERRFARWRIVH